MPLSPQMEKLVRRTRWMPSQKFFGIRFLRKLLKKQYTKRAQKSLAEIPVGTVEDRVIETGGVNTPVRIYTPQGDGPFPALIFIHGGGWCFGSVDAFDAVCRKITQQADCITISIEYGLAPEHKFPEPVEECYAVSQWVFQHAAELNIISGKIAVGGDSAGGNLSAAVCLMARDRGDIHFACQVLIYPLLQIRGLNSRKAYGDMYGLKATDLDFAEDNYVRSSEDMADPLASPLLADSLKGLPPACILTAECDPLVDEGEAYARRLETFGVTVFYKCYAGMVHAFISEEWPVPEVQEAAREAIGDIAACLRNAYA